MVFSWCTTICRRIFRNFSTVSGKSVSIIFIRFPSFHRKFSSSLYRSLFCFSPEIYDFAHFVFQIPIFGLQGLAAPEHMEQMLKTMHKLCQEETGVEETYITQSRDGFIPDNPQLKCYILCLLEKCGMVWFANRVLRFLMISFIDRLVNCIWFPTIK